MIRLFCNVKASAEHLLCRLKEVEVLHNNGIVQGYFIMSIANIFLDILPWKSHMIQCSMYICIYYVESTCHEYASEA